MKPRAILLFIISLAFALTPLMLPSFDGYDPEDFPVQILRPSVQPAGYAFSIWLLIYAGLILHALWGLTRHEASADWDRPRLALGGAMLCGILWVALAEDHPVLATLVILVMAGLALLALLQSQIPPRPIPPRPERWVQLSPVALFAGWVTAAAGAALGVTMAGLGWLSDTTSAVVSIIAVLIVAAVVQLRLGRVMEYALPVIWALIAIWVANRGLNLTVDVLALVGAAAMIGVTLFAARE